MLTSQSGSSDSDPPADPSHESITLLDWIEQQDPLHTIDTLIEHVEQHIEKVIKLKFSIRLLKICV